jgi:hypothetical protein
MALRKVTLQLRNSVVDISIPSRVIRVWLDRQMDTQPFLRARVWHRHVPAAPLGLCLDRELGHGRHPRAQRPINADGPHPLHAPIADAPTAPTAPRCAAVVVASARAASVPTAASATTSTAGSDDVSAAFTCGAPGASLAAPPAVDAPTSLTSAPPAATSSVLLWHPNGRITVFTLSAANAAAQPFG